MHVASFVHSNGSSLFTIIHWPWSMNQRLLVLIQVIPINHHQVSVNYFCFHHWTIIKINQVIDEPEIIQCLILQLPAFNTSCHMPWCHFDGNISTNDNTPHPTPPRPVAEHDTTWSSAAEQQPVCGDRRTWVPEGTYIYIYVFIYNWNEDQKDSHLSWMVWNHQRT